jgi:catechol 2,3-dioxygenase-like lactoylglutathione lyase family enzyme
MQFHHMCITVSDMDRAVALWRDVLGFEVGVDTLIPGEGVSSEVLDDIWGVPGVRARCVVVGSAEGAYVEMLQALNPPVERTPPERLRYFHTGIHELALRVSGIDDWFAKIKNAGYETQTEYVWSGGSSTGRSFLFYDSDGNMIQLWEPGEDDWGGAFFNRPHSQRSSREES